MHRDRRLASNAVNCESDELRLDLRYTGVCMTTTIFFIGRRQDLDPWNFLSRVGHYRTCANVPRLGTIDLRSSFRLFACIRLSGLSKKRLRLERESRIA